MRPGSLVRTKRLFVATSRPFVDVPRGSIGLVVGVEDKAEGLVCTVSLPRRGPAHPLRYYADNLEEISNR